MNRACDRENREDYGKGKWRVHTGTHRDEQRRQGRNNSNSGDVQEPTEEDETSKGGTDLYLFIYLFIYLLNIFKQGRTYRQNHCFTMLPCKI